MISVADTYDVMTSRDSYRRPVSSREAIEELRRVSGAQLDGDGRRGLRRRVLERRSVTFRHADDADFERELALERRVATTPRRARWRRRRRDQTLSDQAGRSAETSR